VVGPGVTLTYAADWSEYGGYQPGDGERFFHLDPLGNLMMRFPQDPDPSRMVKDLQRLLKASRIG